MHRRNAKKLQERRITKIILDHSFFDRKLGETVSKVTRVDVLGALNEPVEVHLVPDVEVEVLTDTRGRGTMQR